MLGILDIVVLAASVLSPMRLQPVETYYLPAPMESMAEVKFHRESWREDGKGKCEFHGVITPFVRDWPLTRQDSDGREHVVSPPAPDKIAGRVVIVNKRVCKDKPVERMFYAGVTKVHGPVLIEILDMGDVNYVSSKEQPKWLVQGLDRFQRIADAGDPAAKAFLDYSAEDVKLARGIADGTMMPLVRKAEESKETPPAQPANVESGG